MRISTAYKQKERSLEECLALIESGDIIAVSGVTTEPVTAYFVSDTPFFTIPRSVPKEMDRKIGRYVADLIHNGDCIQLGIGGLPDAVGEYLKEKNDLGIHTEVLSSSMADLIALTSTAKGGMISKIKPVLSPGAGVSITRNHADTIITEYGVAELRGRTIRERVDALISISHPNFRAQLRQEAKAYGIIV